MWIRGLGPCGGSERSSAPLAPHHPDQRGQVIDLTRAVARASTRTIVLAATGTTIGTTMSFLVDSEIAPLERVLVHEPGPEIGAMCQHDMHELLFDDLLAPDETRLEHALMCDMLRDAGAEVIGVQQALRKALASAPHDDRATLLTAITRQAGVPELRDWLGQLDARKLAGALIGGITWGDVPKQVHCLARLRAQALGTRGIALAPLPNLMFMRDPCVTIYDRIVVGRMAHPARAREPLLVSFALRWGVAEQGPSAPIDEHSAPSSELGGFEGGDVLVLSPQTLLVGCSERTDAATIERLARVELFAAHPRLERIYVVLLPISRSTMHLDTILTQVDRDVFLGFAPLLEHGPGATPRPVLLLTRDGRAEHLRGAAVIDVLRNEIGPHTQLVPCGGSSTLHQAREQWTDGANAVCLSPGHVVLYSRNVRTIAALAERGFGEVRLGVVQSRAERRERVLEAIKRPRAVLSFSGSELSRARGGGRCLTMPLRRTAMG